MTLPIKKIIIDESVLDEALTQRILANAGSTPHEIIPLEDSWIPDGERYSVSDGKRILFVTSQKGDWVKPCPATSSPYLCCRYTIINQITQCPMDCTYCVLQDYLDSPVMTLEARFSRIFQEVDRLLIQQPRRLFRFGTGELSDSLALDPVTGLSKDYARFFSTQRNALIELKTKTDSIEHLRASETANVVVSWSINPQPLVEQEEIFTADLESRLRAARECQDRGFLLGFHFDPILWMPDWEVQYKDLIDQLFSSVDGSRIAWISLGSLRFPPTLKETALSRFPQCRIYFEEMIRGLDGKMRYPKPMRVEMYRKIYRWLLNRSPNLFVYFCMESPDVWDRVKGRHPASNAELDFWFAESLHTRFPELELDEPQLTTYTSHF